MKIRGLALGALLAAVAAYFIFFTKAADRKGGLEIMVDKYGQAKVDLAGADLESLGRVVLEYASGGEGLPDSLEALRRYNPAAGARTDPWGRPIRYEKLSEDSFRLTSAGPDGAFGTADDIVKAF
ncbi:MAG TPA: type II secretion system protein GspG [Candidatus Aminicenantes bacterium]|nr:type II secretion system protein GspG [Candidatus Aminicenantes bacterium]